MRRLSGSLVGVLAVTLLLTACGGSKSADTPTKITVGYIPVMIDAPLYVGIEKGYFKRRISTSISRRWRAARMSSRRPRRATSMSGSAGWASPPSMRLQKNIGIKVVAPLHSETPPVTTPLVVSKKAYDSGQISSVADLKGKKVAINAAGSATEYWLARALEKGGLKLTDVQVETVAFPDVPAALENGAIAASMLGEPIVTQAKDKGQIQVLSDDFISGFFPTIVLYNTKFAHGQEERGAGLHERLHQGVPRLARQRLQDGRDRDDRREIHEGARRCRQALQCADLRPERPASRSMTSKRCNSFISSAAA